MEIRRTRSSKRYPQAQEEEFRQPESVAYATESRTPVPALLHVNLESRAGMLKSYQLSFKGYAVPHQVFPRIYFNFERDKLCWESNQMPWRELKANIPHNQEVVNILGPDRRRLRRLILSDYFVDSPLMRRHRLIAKTFEYILYDSLEHITYVPYPDQKVPSDFTLAIAPRKTWIWVEPSLMHIQTEFLHRVDIVNFAENFLSIGRVEGLGDWEQLWNNRMRDINQAQPIPLGVMSEIAASLRSVKSKLP